MNGIPIHANCNVLELSFYFQTIIIIALEKKENRELHYNIDIIFKEVFNIIIASHRQPHGNDLKLLFKENKI